MRTGMNRPGLFRTVADDALGFGQGARFQPKAVADWLDFSRDEVSRIASVAKSSVRWDESIPKQVQERLEEIGNVANMVAGIFDGDRAKTALWFRTKNPMLGDASPRDMVRLGRYERLRKFVVSAISDRAAEERVQN